MNRDVVLAVLAECRPVARHRFVEVEQPSIDQDQHRRRCQRLARGPDRSDGVLSPGDATTGVGRPAPNLDHRFPVEIDPDRATDVSSVAPAVPRTHRQPARIRSRSDRCTLQR